MNEQHLIQQRNDALRQVYSDIVKASGNMRFVSRKTIISVMLEQSAPRFYITPYWAMKYISGYYRTCNAGKRKQKMIADLVENFERLCKEHPEANRSTLYGLVVEQPAKSFYLSAHRIQEIVFNYKGRN